MGVDLNRNFNVDFGDRNDKGFCNEDYKGPNAFSEKESQAERDYIVELITNDKKLDLFFTFHSYGQQVFFLKDFLKFIFF